MRICLLNCVDVPRSEVNDVGYYLSTRGHEVTIVYPKRGNMDDSVTNGVRHISFPSSFFPKIHYTLPNLHKECQILTKLTKGENYDVIQACEYDYLTSLGPLLIKRKLDIPLILTNDAFPGITWKYGDIFVDSVGKMYTHTLGKLILSSYDILTFLYKDLAQKAIMMGFDKEKIHIIPNGVNLEHFNRNTDRSAIRDKLGIKRNEKLILFVGRLALVKRPDILIKVSESLLKKGWNIKTAIIGDGPYEGIYKKMAESCQNILFLGRIDKKFLPYYYAAADIFILPSLSEGLPTVLLEAAASGKPIIASNVGGISDIIIHGKTGFLAEPENINSFVYYANLLLIDESLSNKIGQSAFEHIKRNFNWVDIIAKYEKLYMTQIKDFP